MNEEEQQELEICEQSDCINPADPSHVCPYKAEINEDEETLCNCCPSCYHECLMDI